MRRPWFAAKPVDEGIFSTAPVRLRDIFEVPQSASLLWGELTDEHPFAWCRLLRSVSWTSPRPFGVGTTRSARTIGNASAIHARYFRWEEGRRQSFYAVESSLPLFRSLAEDYLVEPTGERTCRFTWTIAIDPHPLSRPANPINRAIFSTLFRDTRKHYGVG